MYYWGRCRRKIAEASIADIKRALDLQVAARSAERTGRIRVEKRLREQLSAPLNSAGPEGAFPFQPIGYLQSCFSQRNGTPRQPLLACNARAKLVLRPDIPVGCLEGLEQYSHVWILFVFHCNTDLQRLWSPSHAADGLKAKVQVPRLNGGRMGVLATRSPHRPAPIGLSVAEVIAVQGRTLIVGGVDIVDGSPVLDVKPYLPFCDSLPSATAPSWVSDNLQEDTLSMAEVTISREATEQLQTSWAAKGGAMKELYPAFDEFLELFRQGLFVKLVLRDIDGIEVATVTHGVGHRHG
ncbi:g1291 [Coccomyxa elongata]